MPVITLKANNTTIFDTYVEQSEPDANRDYVSSMGVGINAGKENWALVRYVLGLIPNNAIINSATVTLKNDSAGTYDLDVAIHEITSEWDEQTVTWNTKPSHNPYIEATFTRVAQTSFTYNIDITNIVRKWVNGENYGFLIKPVDNWSGPNVLTYFSLKPALTIDYSIPTDDKKQVEFVGHTEHTTPSTSTTQDVPLPNNVIEGDMLVATMYTTQATEFEIPSGWALIDRVTTGGVNPFIYILSKKYDGINNEPFKVKFVSDAPSITFVMAFRNVKTVHAHEGVENRTLNNLCYPNPPTDLEPNRMILLLCAVANTGYIFTPPLNFEQVAQRQHTGKLYVARGYNHNKVNYTNEELASKLSVSHPGISGLISLEPITNEVPHIDGQDEDLGAYDTPIVKQYTVTDTESDNITITEKLNGEVIGTKTGEGTHTIDLTSVWDSLPLGKHTITIEANDDYNNPPHEPLIRTWTFTKLLQQKAKVPQIVSGLGDVITKFEGLKHLLVDKVGGDPSLSLEEIIEKIGLKKWSGGTWKPVTSSPNTFTKDNLNFRPSIVLVSHFTGGGEHRYSYWDTYYKYGEVNTAAYFWAPTNVNGSAYVGNLMTITENGFSLKIANTTTLTEFFEWIAIE